MEGYIAQILFFAGSFAPRNWAFCEGQIMQIASNTALFSLLGTTYGGNGTTTFALPDFRGRVPVGAGQGPGLSSVTIGEKFGSPATTLTIVQMPAHTHTAAATVAAASTNGSSASPNGNIFATTGANAFAATSNGLAAPGTLSLGVFGGNQPFTLQQPTLAINFVICLYGYYPSRN